MFKIVSGFSSGKFGVKHRNQQTITCQVSAELNKIWSCLIFIKLYSNNVPQSGLLFIKECCIIISFQIVFKFVFLAFIFSGASKGLLFFFIGVKWVVELSRMCTKLAGFWAKKQNTQRKWLHFVDRRFAELSKSAKI